MALLYIIVFKYIIFICFLSLMSKSIRLYTFVLYILVLYLLILVKVNIKGALYLSGGAAVKYSIFNVFYS